MTKTVQLRDIAAARSGDKGNISNISLWPYDPKHYPLIRDQITPERIRQAFPDWAKGEIVRYEMPELAGFNFVLNEALEGGVSASLNLDTHGKSLSFLLLSLTIDIESGLAGSG